jgi:hypothetical protein
MTRNQDLKPGLVECVTCRGGICTPDNLHGMAASWKKPGRARRVLIDVEDGGTVQYWRSEQEDGTVLWRESADVAGGEPSGDAMTTADLLKAIGASLSERRRSGRGLKFRL